MPIWFITKQEEEEEEEEKMPGPACSCLRLQIIFQHKSIWSEIMLWWALDSTRLGRTGQGRTEAGAKGKKWIGEAFCLIGQKWEISSQLFIFLLLLLRPNERAEPSRALLKLFSFLWRVWWLINAGQWFLFMSEKGRRRRGKAPEIGILLSWYSDTRTSSPVQSSWVELSWAEP